jgi:hypothetical protein
MLVVCPHHRKVSIEIENCRVIHRHARLASQNHDVKLFASWRRDAWKRKKIWQYESDSTIID